MNHLPEHTIELDPNVIKGTLENGLTYYIRQNTMPIHKVELRLVVNAGSVCETESQRGLAHFIEHMAFKGTENFGGTQVIKHLSSLGVEFGVDLNASTGFDRTLYIIPIASKHIDSALQVIKDWAFGVLFENEAIESERSVILEELRTGQGADQRMRDRWFPKLMEGTKYENRMPIGLKKVIKNAPREEFIKFYNHWYRPENMALVVVGDIDPADVELKIRQLFDVEAPAQDGLCDAVCLDTAQQKEQSNIIIETDPEAQYNIAQLIFKRPFEEIKTTEQYCDFVLRNIYIAMLNARLVELSQGEHPIFIYGNAYYYHLVKTTDAFVIYVILPSDNKIVKPVSRLIEEVARIDKYGFSEKEFVRARDSYLNHLHRRLIEKDKTNSAIFADEYVFNFTEGDASPGIVYEYELSKEFLQTVDIKRINEAADLLFSKDRTLLLTGYCEKFPQHQELSTIYETIHNSPISPWDEEEVPEDLLKNPPKEVPLLSRKEIPSIGVTELIFEGGVKVVLKPSANKNDEILFSAYRPGGRSLYHPQLHIPSLLSSRTVEESGMGEFTKSALKKYLAGKTVTLGMSINNYQDNLSGYSSTKDIKTLFELIYLGLTSARFSEQVFDSQKEKSMAILKASLDDPGEYFADFIKRTLSSSHHRGDQAPAAEDIERAKYEDAKKAFEQSFAHPEQFTFLFVGNFTVEQMIPLIGQYIAPLGTNTPMSGFMDFGVRPPTGKYEQTIRKGMDDRAVVSMIFDTKVAYSVKLACAFKGLGEFLKIRLIDRLRSEMGAVYGVRVESDFIRVPYSHTRLHINISCSPDNYKVLIEAALEELNDLIENSPSPTVVNNVKTTLIRQIEDAYQRNGFWMMQLQRMGFLGDDIERVGSLIEELDNITVDNIQQAARSLINTEEFICVTMLGENSPLD